MRRPSVRLQALEVERGAGREDEAAAAVQQAGADEFAHGALELGLRFAHLGAGLLLWVARHVVEAIRREGGGSRAAKEKCCTSEPRCYTSIMPTTKPRYTVTDSGAVSELLDEAQRRWPEVDDRKELLLRLAAAGREAIEREGAARRAAVAETAGALSGVYEPGELARLREDWPG